MKKLYLSKTDKKVFGVIGGIAEYFNVDSTVLRLLFIVLLLLTGLFPFGIAYLIAAIIVPEPPFVATSTSHNEPTA